MATIQDVKDLLVAQASKDPRQTLYRVRALVFGDAPSPVAEAEEAVTEEAEEEESGYHA